MGRNIKKEMRNRANLIRGLARVIADDADFISSDVNSYDWVALNESLTEAKHTLQSLMDNMTELEYMLYMMRQE